METRDINLIIGFNDLIEFSDIDDTNLTRLNPLLIKLTELLNVETDILERHRDFLNSPKMWNEGNIIVYESKYSESKLIINLAIEGNGYDLIQLGCIYSQEEKKEVISIIREIFDNSESQVYLTESCGNLSKIINESPKIIDLGNGIKYTQLVERR